MLHLARFLRRTSLPLQSTVAAGFRTSTVVNRQAILEEKRSKRATSKTDVASDVDTSFMTDVYQQETFAKRPGDDVKGQFQPYRPDNWEELLAAAEASYPARAGPRRNKQAERERNRRWVIHQQDRVAKKQLAAAEIKKQAGIKKELYKMREAYAKYGYPPALEYAKAVGDATSAGLGGRMGSMFFGPLFRDGTFDPHRKIDGSSAASQ